MRPPFRDVEGRRGQVGRPDMGDIVLALTFGHRYSWMTHRTFALSSIEHLRADSPATSLPGIRL